MIETQLVKPELIPPLDADFRPAVLYNRIFRQKVEACRKGAPVALALERSDGSRSRYETVIFPDDHPLAGENNFYIERVVKFLMWQQGGLALVRWRSRKRGQNPATILLSQWRTGV